MFATALIAAAPGKAETGAGPGSAPIGAIRFRADDPIQLERRGFSFPVVEYTDERGARQQRKGIIASKMITPDMMVGVGLFETTPKTRGYWGDIPQNVTPRRSRKAASIGLNWRF
jgi:hypothetical protein